MYDRIEGVPKGHSVLYISFELNLGNGSLGDVVGKTVDTVHGTGDSVPLGCAFVVSLFAAYS